MPTSLYPICEVPQALDERMMSDEETALDSSSEGISFSETIDRYEHADDVFSVSPSSNHSAAEWAGVVFFLGPARAKALLQQVEDDPSGTVLAQIKISDLLSTEDKLTYLTRLVDHYAGRDGYELAWLTALMAREAMRSPFLTVGNLADLNEVLDPLEMTSNIAFLLGHQGIDRVNVEIIRQALQSTGSSNASSAMSMPELHVIVQGVLGEAAALELIPASSSGMGRGMNGLMAALGFPLRTESTVLNALGFSKRQLLKELPTHTGRDAVTQRYRLVMVLNELDRLREAGRGVTPEIELLSLLAARYGPEDMGWTLAEFDAALVTRIERLPAAHRGREALLRQFRERTARREIPGR